jgi:hypothetical protein
MGSQHTINRISTLNVLFTTYLNPASDQKLVKLQISFVTHPAWFRGSTSSAIYIYIYIYIHTHTHTHTHTHIYSCPLHRYNSPGGPTIPCCPLTFNFTKMRSHYLMTESIEYFIFHFHVHRTLSVIQKMSPPPLSNLSSFQTCCPQWKRPALRCCFFLFCDKCTIHRTAGW